MGRVIEGEGAGTKTRAVSRSGLVGLMDGLPIHRNDQKCWLINTPFEKTTYVLDARWPDGQQTLCERSIVVLCNAKWLEETGV